MRAHVPMNQTDGESKDYQKIKTNRQNKDQNEQRETRERETESLEKVVRQSKDSQP